MEYTSYKDFVKRADEIKAKYNMMKRPQKWEYKKYVYSKDMLEVKKDRIWMYLNDDIEKYILILLIGGRNANSKYKD